MIEVKSNKIYANNTVNDAVVLAAKQLLECHDEIEVSFDVMGRTLHETLAHQLYAKLDTNIYSAEIDYWSYGCRIFKKSLITLVTIEVLYTDAQGDTLVHYIKRGFTKHEDAEMLMKQGMHAELDLKKLLGELYTEGDTFKGYGDITIEAITMD